MGEDWVAQTAAAPLNETAREGDRARADVTSSKGGGIQRASRLRAMGLLRALGLAERRDAGASGKRATSFTNSLTNAAVCEKRKPANVDDVLSAPGVARLNAAVSKEHPYIGPGGRSDYSVIQQVCLVRAQEWKD